MCTAREPRFLLVPRVADREAIGRIVGPEEHQVAHLLPLDVENHHR